MRGMVAVDDVIASLPKERQKKFAARRNELLEKVQRRMTLSEIRKGRKISHAKMAEALGTGQMQTSQSNLRRCCPGEFATSRARVLPTLHQESVPCQRNPRGTVVDLPLAHQEESGLGRGT